MPRQRQKPDGQAEKIIRQKNNACRGFELLQALKNLTNITSNFTFEALKHTAVQPARFQHTPSPDIPYSAALYIIFCNVSYTIFLLYFLPVYYSCFS